MGLNRLQAAAVTTLALAIGSQEARADQAGNVSNDIRNKISVASGNMDGGNGNTPQNPTTPGLLAMRTPKPAPDTSTSQQTLSGKSNSNNDHGVQAALSATQGLVLAVTGEHRGVDATSTNVALGLEVPIRTRLTVAPEVLLGLELPLHDNANDKNGANEKKRLAYFVGGGVTAARSFDRFIPSATAFGGVIINGRDLQPVVGAELGLELRVFQGPHGHFSFRAAAAAMAKWRTPDSPTWLIEPQIGIAGTIH